MRMRLVAFVFWTALVGQAFGAVTFQQLREDDRRVVVHAMADCLTNNEVYGCGVITPLTYLQRLNAQGESKFDSKACGTLMRMGLKPARFPKIYFGFHDLRYDCVASDYVCFAYLNGEQERLKPSCTWTQSELEAALSRYDPLLLGSGEYFLCFFRRQTDMCYMPWTFGGTYEAGSNRYVKICAEVPSLLEIWKKDCYLIPRFCAAVIKDADVEEQDNPNWSDMTRLLVRGERENVRNFGMMNPVLRLSPLEASEVVYCGMRLRGVMATSDEFNEFLVKSRDRFLCEITENDFMTDIGRRVHLECQKKEGR